MVGLESTGRTDVTVNNGSEGEGFLRRPASQIDQGDIGIVSDVTATGLNGRWVTFPCVNMSIEMICHLDRIEGISGSEFQNRVNRSFDHLSKELSVTTSSHKEPTQATYL